MSGRRFTILGGPHDGAIVPDSGMTMQMPEVAPLPPFSDLLAEDAIPPVALEFRTTLYHARQDHDGRWWYVHADVLRALET